MEHFWKLLGAVLSACLAISFSKEAGFRWLIAAACCCLCGILVSELLKPVLQFFDRLFSLSGIDPALITPVFKAALIAALSQIGAAYCADHSEKMLAELLELGSCCAILYVSLPVYEAALNLLQRLSER